MADKVMSEAVRDVLEKTLVQETGLRDVHILAAERLAIDFIANAWLELEKYKPEKEREASNLRQVGL